MFPSPAISGPEELVPLNSAQLTADCITQADSWITKLIDKKGSAICYFIDVAPDALDGHRSSG
jgi:hypothetical protein